ncbi:MAG: hypothetical protein ACOYMF_05215 [Bacteroidales bacterium]
MELERYRIDPDEIKEFIETGQAGNMPVEYVKYLEQMELVRSMYSKYKSRNFILNYLVETFKFTRRRADMIYSDSVNFFYAEHKVKKEAWRNVYAEMLDNAARVAWEQNDMEKYRRCIESAAKMRGLDKEDPALLPEELLDRRTIIIQTDPERFNIPKASRSELAKFIDGLDVAEMDKHKLRQDAGIIDVEFMDEDGKANIPE